MNIKLVESKTAEVIQPLLDVRNLEVVYHDVVFASERCFS